jgi:cobalt-zinc-cadmium efflux system outer membrane protein
MRQATMAPPDRVNLSLEEFAGTGNTSGVSGIEATLSLSRTLELGGKATYRGDVIEYQAILLRNKKDIDRLDIMTETARRYLHVVTDNERLNIANDAIELIQLTQKAVDERVRAGRTSASESKRITIDMANSQLEFDHRRHEMESSRLALSSMWGDLNADFELAEVNLFDLVEVADFNQLAELLERNPELVRFSRDEDLARAKIRVAQSRSRPDLVISSGLRYLGNNDDIAFVISASIPLGSKKRASAYVDEANAIALQAPVELQQRKLQLYSTLFELYQELKHARDAVMTLRETIIPAASEMLVDYESGYQAGRYSILELLQIQKLLLSSRTREIEMAADYHEFRIEIDRLTGAQLGHW